MAKALIIGGRGKVGSYLTPMLVKQGYNVINVSRGKTRPYVENACWDTVTQLTLDTGAADFPQAIAQQNADVVIDMICFTNEDMQKLTKALRGQNVHYLVCGSAWMHGHSEAVPVLEDECRTPLEEYGIQKSLMDYEIQRLYKEEGFCGSIVHPGHIVCPGDVPINPQGFKSLSSFEMLKNAQPLYLPNFGMETLHHVHAQDVAGVFLAAINAKEPSYGQGFHAVSQRAVTLRGYAAQVASWYGKTADLRYEPFETWAKRVTQDEAEQTLTHILHSPSCSMQKAKDLLGFTPKHTSYEAIRECIASFGL